MGKAVTVRDVPEDVVKELATRAARDGRSLQEYLRGELIGLASRPDINYWLAGARANREAFGIEISTEDILAARDEDRR
nr:hypothetical protein [Propionicimonas sp.]